MPKAVRDKRILRGPLRGYRIVTSWHDYPGAILGRTERPLLDWFEKNVSPGETWLDVGAHYGYTAIALGRFVGAAGRVFAFEPMLGTAGCVAQTRLLNHFPQLTIIPMALADPAELTLGQLPTVRGMVDSTIQAGVWNETILAARLDWLWPQICGRQQRIDGIKIDVQGMEIATLRGMIELLKSYRPKLVVELHHGVARAELMDLLKAAGYSSKAVAIEPVEGEIEPQYIDDRSYAFLAAT
jgi:FkbM family methyltransferase